MVGLQARPNFVNCIFRYNGHEYDAGGSIVVRTLAGGGVLVQLGAPTFTNCLFHDNAAYQGGGIQVVSVAFTDVPVFHNCTVTQNAATLNQPGARGGGISTNWGVVLRNCIVWQNTAAATEPNLYDPRGGSSIEYTDIEGGWFAIGNKNVDPLFINPANDDFRISLVSPCKNTGQFNFLPADVGDLDWDGDTSEELPKDLGLLNRRLSFRLDMGAHEFFLRIGPGSW